MRALGAGWLAAAAVLLCTALWSTAEVAQAQVVDPCDPPIQNAIVAENCLTGNPQSEWDVTGGGDPDIQGFATDISVDQGQTVHFKVDTPSSAYHLDIYRMGYYGGLGARKVATVTPSATLPQAQPDCIDDPETTGLTDCGNWAESASWAVPADAVSGIYFAKLVRTDQASDGSHIFFIVRDDDGGSDLLFQTQDTTWQAYNQYGGRSLYQSSDGGPGTNPARAYKVSYNRPLTTRGPTPEDSPFNAEYPMVRFLERNGYDVSYFTGVDSARFGSEIQEHQAFLSVGHDEYWSATQRANVEAARAAGVDLAFFSGNESFWKTRWEPSTADGSSTDHRTLVCYKETHANAKIDPEPNVWTGTWRDPRFSPPADGGRPENAVTGTMFRVNSGTSAIDVPAADGRMRIWRNTSVASQAPGQTATLTDGTLGYEWDEAPENGVRPAGLVQLSSTTRSGVQILQDFGSTYGSGTATHHLTMYKAPSGALVFGAGTIQWSWGLDGNHDRGSSTPDPRMQQATVNVLADMGAQPDTLQGDLVPATASTDTDPPSSVINSPLDGSNVESGQPVTISGTATDAAGESGGGQVGSVEVSTDGGTTWHPAQGRANWTYSWTPGATGSATIKTRAADDSANLETPSAGVTVNVTSRTCPCSIWNDSFTAPEENDPAAVELGVKFRSDEAGFITGLRFYKTSGNTGTHVGHLWTTDGTPLAEASFGGETASGWQEVSLDNPVEINANTTYIASYHAPAGHYAATSGYFASGGFDSAPLHALGDGVDGSNGVYRYGPSGSFPTDTFQSSNYWVDVVFENTVGPDTTPPTITARSPVDAATNVSSGANVTATFSEPMDPATINGTTFELRDSSNALVPAAVTYNAAQRRAILDPNSALQNSTTYTATVKGGAGGVTDDASPANALASDSTWSFTTAAPPPPPPDEGPGGPILVISNAANPFSRYFAEILRAEGLNEFTATDITNVTTSVLNAHDVAILGEGPLSAGQAQMLSDWVQAGGNLIANRPDPQLAGLLGLTPAGTPLSNAYLQVDTGAGPGAGIVGQTIQYHGSADRYTTNGAQTIATLYSDATTATANPAVTMQTVGTNGGHAAAFTYDLARSIVYTHQGNPAWSGDERDSSVGGSQLIRSDDLFFGAKTGDVQPDWVDLNKVAIPQADEQQHLLTNLIEQMNLDRKPLPRFWFLPHDKKAAVVMTGDDHGNGGTVGRFQQYQADSPSGCSVADWQCVRGTSYVYPGTPITDSQAAAFQSQGFEIALHVLTNCQNWSDQAQLESFYSSQLAAFAADYPSLNPPATNRTHCIAWSDWATQPKVELENGIRLDTNYYYWPPDWIQDRPGMFTGSGMPMRFADLDGSMIDVYQATTQMTDESGQTYPFNIDSLLNKALGTEGYYGIFTANMHTDNVSSAGSDAIVASAQSRGVPIVSAQQMLQWLDGRNQSSFNGISWSGNTLSFSVSHAAGANGLRGMVPTTSSVGALTTLKRDGVQIPATDTQTIKGREYAFFDATAGNYEATYAIDNTAPTISDVAASAHGDGTADITWNTDEASDSRVDYGTSADSLTSQQSSPGLTTSHNTQLSGLMPNTTYYYRVSSTDAANNTATEPNPPAAPASFTTPSATFTDTTVSDFGAGTPDANTYISQTGNGEVTLKPTEGQEFSGGSLPTGWESGVWTTGGGATVSSGLLHVDGGFARTTATYGSGRSLEFVANLSGQAAEHVGFGVDLNNDPNWAIFSVMADGSFNARTNGPATTNTPLPSNLLGSPHLYRIEWGATEVRFYVDGALVATQAANFGTTQMRPIASDFTAGGGEVSVDWIRMTPYPASGTFTSRVFDAGQAAEWGALTWHANAPPNTSVQISVRTGDTPTPDGTWSAFTPINSSGGDIPGNSRYVQYQAQLGSSDPNQTPTLSDVSIAYTTGADTTAPTITQRTPAPNATDVPRNTNVDVQFSEPMNPATIDSSTVRLRKQGAGSDVPASVSYAGNTATIDPNADLDPGAVYNVTVAGTVTDANGIPLGADDTWSFTTASLSFIDTTVSDFSAGTPGPNTYVSETENGEVTLKPTEGSEFSGGPDVPSGWQVTPWNVPSTGGSATVTGGELIANGASAGTTQTYGAGRALEFKGTFSGANNQHVGFGVDFNNSTNWAMFSVKGDGTFNARTAAGSINPANETQLSSDLIGESHVFRIEWATPTQVRYYVGGELVAEHTTGFDFGATQMRPLASDLVNGDGGDVRVDWLHMSPYPGSGTFDSRVFDAGAGQTADWGALSWNSAMPSGTGIALSVRTGDTPTPDGTWSAFTPINTSGGDIPGNSRFVQYQAQLTSSDPAQTPTLSQVSIAYTTGADTTPPTITQRTPAQNATDVPRNTNVDVQFSEPMNPATINSSTVRLRKQGSGTDVAATVSYSGTTATLDPNADLDPSAVYNVTVAGTVTDANGIPLGADDTWSFTTAAPSFNFTDTTVSDFSAGALDANTYISETGNGEVILKPTEGQEFSGGPGLPAGWSSSTWESSGGGAGGTAAVSGGSLHVDGAIAGTDATFGPGHSLEFVATFGATAFQHVGFGVDVNTSPNWAMFSTNDTADLLFARTNVGGTAVNTQIGSSNQYVGSPHLYRIEWDTAEIRYYVDGALVTTQAANFVTTQMRPLASDFNSGGPNLSVDWLHLSPYPASGTFDSRVFDAGSGQSVNWGALTWNSATPSGTGIAMSVRTGDTATPDGSWSAFTPIAAPGGDIPGNSRYVQYRAVLSTTDANLTPTLSEVTINGAGDIPPTAVNDSATVAEDAGATAINVLANDTDADGGPMTIASASDPANGTVAVAPDNLSLSYTPDPNYCNEGGPTDDFTYTLNGGSTATVAVTVTCVDDDPVAVEDAATVAEDSAATQINVLANDTDADGGPMTIASASDPANGTVAVAPDNLSLSYTPDPNYCNEGGPTDDFTYTLNGGSTATVAVTVTCVDDDPVAVEDAATVAEDSAATQINVLANDTDADGGPMTIASASDPANGTVAVAPDNLSLSYTPDPNYCNESGPTDDFTYTLNGGSTATVAVTVSCVDDPPVAVDDSATVSGNSGPNPIDVLANDTDVDDGPKTIDSVTQPANGTVAITGGGTGLTYQPDAGYCSQGGSTDDFTYTLSPGGSTATVAITVDCSTPPVAVDDTATVAEDSGATQIDVLANDTDPDGGDKTIQSVTQPANGTVAIAADNLSLTYTPNPDYCNDGSPTDDFTYTLSPGGSTATVAVTVSCVDDPPVAVDDSSTVSGNSGPNPIDVLANDTDTDGGPKAIDSVTQPTHGTVAITGGGSGLTYEPDAGYCSPAGSTDDFTYTLSPGGSTATVAVTVSCVDDPPVAVDDSATVSGNSGPSPIDVLANDTDTDGGPKAIDSVTQPTHGTVAITGGGSGLTYEPDAGYCSPAGSTDDFTYTLSPGGSTATVAVTVSCVDDPPTAVNDTATVAEDSGATAIDVLANDTDTDGGPKTIDSVTQPTHGTVAITGGGTGLTYTRIPTTAPAAARPTTSPTRSAPAARRRPWR